MEPLVRRKVGIFFLGGQVARCHWTAVAEIKFLARTAAGQQSEPSEIYYSDVKSCMDAAAGEQPDVKLHIVATTNEQ